MQNQCLQCETACSKRRRFQVAALAGGPSQELRRRRPTCLEGRSCLSQAQFVSRDNIGDGKKIKNSRDQDRENVGRKRRTQHLGKAGPGSRSTPERWPEASTRVLNELEGQQCAVRLSRDDSWQMMELKKIQVQSSMEIDSDLSQDLDLHDHQQHNEAYLWPRRTHTGP